MVPIWVHENYLSKYSSLVFLNFVKYLGNIMKEKVILSQIAWYADWIWCYNCFFLFVKTKQWEFKGYCSLLQLCSRDVDNGRGQYIRNLPEVENFIVWSMRSINYSGYVLFLLCLEENCGSQRTSDIRQQGNFLSWKKYFSQKMVLISMHSIYRLVVSIFDFYPSI